MFKKTIENFRSTKKIKPELKPESKSELKPELKSESKSKSRSKSKSKSKSKSRSRSKPLSKPIILEGKITEEPRNYSFIISGMGCINDKTGNIAKRLILSSELRKEKYKLKYNDSDMFFKCYEKKEKSMIFIPTTAVTSIIDRAINPFNFPHKNFSPEIRDSYSPKLHESDDYEEKETESLLHKVKKRLLLNKGGIRGENPVNVFVYGHSYGGLIVNRLCQELQLIADRDSEFKEILYWRFKAIGLNSIFVSDPHSVRDVNIINYMNIGDVSLRLNRQLSVPRISNLNKTNIFLKIKYLYDTSKKIVWFSNYNNKDEIIEPIIDGTIVQKFAFGTKDEWSRHNNGVNMINIINNFLSDGNNEPDSMNTKFMNFTHYI